MKVTLYKRVMMKVYSKVQKVQKMKMKKVVAKKVMKKQQL